MDNNSKGLEFEVFLGGSCNPTTWRQDVIIPALKEMGISFFNPLADEVKEDIEDLKHKAKQSALVLFFVLDDETRIAESAAEVAYLAATFASKPTRHMVVVIQKYKRNLKINEQSVKEEEYLKLFRTQATLGQMVQKQNVSVFFNLESALQHTVKLLKGVDFKLNVDVQSDTVLFVDDASTVNSVIPFENIAESTTAIQYEPDQWASDKGDDDSKTVTIIIESIDKIAHDSSDESITENDLQFQINGYIIDEIHQVYNWIKEILDSSDIVIFSITKEALCTTTMILAAHWIGLRSKDVVLCVQPLEGNDYLTDEAVKDYNRGRDYLIDLAKREKVPVFDTLEEAMEYVIDE